MGIWFSSNKEGASAYGPKTIEAQIDMQNPRVFSGKDAFGKLRRSAQTESAVNPEGNAEVYRETTYK